MLLGNSLSSGEAATSEGRWRTSEGHGQGPSTLETFCSFLRELRKANRTGRATALRAAVGADTEGKKGMELTEQPPGTEASSVPSVLTPTCLRNTPGEWQGPRTSRHTCLNRREKPSGRNK